MKLMYGNDGPRQSLTKTYVAPSKENADLKKAFDLAEPLSVAD